MTWSKRDLDEALAAYERALVASGRTPGTITTYVGDARRFVEWLAGERRLRKTAPPAQPVARPIFRSVSPANQPASTQPVPALRELVRRWTAAGKPRQAPIAWPRDRWRRTLPQHAVLLRALPDRLDREAVRQIARRAAEGEDASEAGFVATMVWGFGSVGYGPHRTATMLSLKDTRGHLHEVALAARDAGALEAYRQLAVRNRIQGLGPAFGTKFIAFCQPTGVQPAALIHDDLVSSWLRAHGRPDLASASWVPSRYEAYLAQMAAWAEDLHLPTETLEYLIFQSMADARGSQWAVALGPRT